MLNYLSITGICAFLFSIYFFFFWFIPVTAAYSKSEAAKYIAAIHFVFIAFFWFIWSTWYFVMVTHKDFLMPSLKYSTFQSQTLVEGQ